MPCQYSFGNGEQSGVIHSRHQSAVREGQKFTGVIRRTLLIYGAMKIVRRVVLHTPILQVGAA